VWVCVDLKNLCGVVRGGVWGSGPRDGWVAKLLLDVIRENWRRVCGQK